MLLTQTCLMKKIFISNLVLVILLNVLVKPFYIFGIDRGVQNSVGTNEYGLYFALYNFVYLFQIINDFGLQNYNHSVLSKHQQLIPKYLPKILATKLVLGIIFIVAVIAGAAIIGFSNLIWPLLLFLVINQVLLSFIVYARTTLSALGHYHLDSMLSVSDKFIMIFGVGYILWFSQMQITIVDFVVGQTISLFLSLSLAFFFVWQNKALKRLRLQFDANFSLALLKKSTPYALVLLLMTLYTRMDGVMLERLLNDGKEQAGIYAASYRILDAFSNVGLLFAGLLLPMFAKQIKLGVNTSELTLIARNTLLSFSLLIICVSTVYHDLIISILYPDATEYWSSVYQVLFISYLGISLGYIYGTLLTANESIRSMNLIFLGGVLLNFVLNVILIPQWKAWGAALATVITQLLTSFFLLILAYRKLGLRQDFTGWLRLGVYCVTIYIFSLWARTWQVSFLIPLTSIGSVALISAWTIGLIRPREWMRSQP